MWCDYEGHDLPGFNVEGSTIKWEITLYQGNCDFDPGCDPDNESTMPWSINYDNIRNDWYDMRIASGTILGSTPERIQIASAEDEADHPEIPVGTETNALVLQTRYIQLGNNNNGKLDGNRVYVKSYDATYGHVYPLADSLDATDVDNKKYCQFFKHSNNPEDILAGDIVTYGTDQDIELTGPWNRKDPANAGNY